MTTKEVGRRTKEEGMSNKTVLVKGGACPRRAAEAEVDRQQEATRLRNNLILVNRRKKEEGRRK